MIERQYKPLKIAFIVLITILPGSWLNAAWIDHSFPVMGTEVTVRFYLDNAEQFNEISLPYEDPMRQRWLLPIDQKYIDWQKFKEELPEYQVLVISAELAFQKFLREAGDPARL